MVQELILDVTYQVVVGEVGDIDGLHAEILERLGLRVNDLVHELTLNLIGGQGVPPEGLVQDTSDGLENGLGNVDVSTLLEDFLVHKLSDLGHAVLLRSVQLVGLASSGVVVKQLLESGTNINGL